MKTMKNPTTATQPQPLSASSIPMKGSIPNAYHDCGTLLFADAHSWVSWVSSSSLPQNDWCTARRGTPVVQLDPFHPETVHSRPEGRPERRVAGTSDDSIIPGSQGRWDTDLVSYSTRMSDQMNRHPSLRYAGAAVFMCVIAVRDSFVLAAYPPSSASAWFSLAIGAVLAGGAAALTVMWSPATTEVRNHPEWMLAAGVSLILIIFGAIEGLGFIPVGGPIDLAGESALVRSFACGAVLGGIALFGLGSHRAVRKVRQQRLASSTETS
jgi:hypothetical protein